MSTGAADFVLTITTDDRRGLVAAVANSIASQDCNIAESAQYWDTETNRFFMRVAFMAPENMTMERFSRGFDPVATAYQLAWQIHDLNRKPRVLIMVSRMGHCLNDLLYRHSIGNLEMNLVGVASNHENWRSRVEHEGVPFHHIPTSSESKDEQEEKLLLLMEEEKIELVILARYMQVLSDDLSAKLFGKVINIHHSFLPSFMGTKPYQRAHSRGVKLIGATAHYVTPDLDDGPIIEQDVGRVEHSMTADEFIAIGREIESSVLARAVKYHIERRILLNGDKTVIF
ncbi:MAG: formyltetrahydrofolate deformylase [Stappiaceae bacterium]